MNVDQSKDIKKENKRAFGLLIGALLILFLSEAILREASVASLKTGERDIDSVLSLIPTFLRNRVRARIELMELKDAVLKAKTDIEKINALSALASYTSNKKEKEDLFSEVLNLPKRTESCMAICYFLEKDDSHRKISIDDFHTFIKESPTLDRYHIWSLGLQELKNKNKSREIQLAYLSPLLSETPEFYDYRQLYKAIYDLALKLNDKEKAKRADELFTLCEELPTIFEEMEKIEKARMGAVK